MILLIVCHLALDSKNDFKIMAFLLVLGQTSCASPDKRIGEHTACGGEQMAQATVSAIKGHWLMALILSFKRPKDSMKSTSLLAKDGVASKKIDTLTKFEDTEINREIVVCRAMNCEAPIHAEKWDDMAKDKDEIGVALNQL